MDSNEQKRVASNIDAETPATFSALNGVRCWMTFKAAMGDVVTETLIDAEHVQESPSPLTLNLL